MQFNGKGMVDGVGPEALKQLLTRGWMTHDGMWFAFSLAESGIETTNRINKAAIRAMAPVEIKRLKKALGVESVNSIGELKRFMTNSLTLLMGDFMEFDWQWLPSGGMRMTMGRCFAHEGITSLGAIDRYECGIYHRIYAWLGALGVSYRVTPDTEECLKHHTGQCTRQIDFDLPREV